MCAKAIWKFSIQWYFFIILGLTVSKAQLQEAQERVKAAGLEDQVNLIFCDYRSDSGIRSRNEHISAFQKSRSTLISILLPCTDSGNAQVLEPLIKLSAVK